jgi:hypothetical protein
MTAMPVTTYGTREIKRNMHARSGIKMIFAV